MPGEIIYFDGNTKSNTTLNITLNNPDDVVMSSTHVSTNEGGSFSSTLDIPKNAKDGIWNVFAESGTDRLSVEITILAIIPDTDRNNVTSHLLSPLKQFKSGVQTHAIMCKQELQLIKKKTDSSPACVKPSTASRLIELGWGEPAVIVEGGWKQNK
ncbi:hypothetical protein HY212_02190 [Candidatus Pacearchaeota archaeon]|nr:hypothetical protein [Candidatus Pacearchaeota archaeon]